MYRFYGSWWGWCVQVLWVMMRLVCTGFMGHDEVGVYRIYGSWWGWCVQVLWVMRRLVCTCFMSVMRWVCKGCTGHDEVGMYRFYRSWLRLMSTGFQGHEEVGVYRFCGSWWGWCVQVSWGVMSLICTVLWVIVRVCTGLMGHKEFGV